MTKEKKLKTTDSSQFYHLSRTLLVEQWKNALENKHLAKAVLMDFPKAFLLTASLMFNSFQYCMLMALEETAKRFSTLI